MNEEKLEKISALMDGELTGREKDVIIEGIETDRDTRGSWERYHIIGDTMRSTMPRTVDPGLASRLNTMLDQEPTIIAPRPKRKINYTKPLMGLAIAASITAITILGVQTSKQQQIPGIDSLEGELPQVAIIDSEQNPASVVVEQSLEGSLVNASSVRTVKYEADENSLNSQQLNRYIMNHNQHNSRMGMQGVSPQARLVGHEEN